MTDSFWTGGPEAYAKILRAKYQTKLRKRRVKLDDAKCDELDAKIEGVDLEFQSKVDSIDDCLF